MTDRLASVTDVDRWFRAPGRVNLIGDHTDYNEGFVLPLAVDLECVVGSRPTATGMVRVRSLDLDDEHADVEVRADGSDDPAAVVPDWGRYAAGVVRALAERGRPATGIDAVVASALPIGAGLASSAALEVGVALALCDAAHFELPPEELALACQRAEQIATGVPCGIMDQLTSIVGRRDHALLIDCRSLEVESVPFPPELTVIVMHCGLSRALADSAYAERRRECEEIANRLGLRSLRDATPEQVADAPRARHVVSENARVLDATRALADGDAERLGRLLSESHRSLRDDYEVSTPELDALVAALEAAGAFGARLTGAGFGGCVVALAGRAEADPVAEAAASRYREQIGLEPTAFICSAEAGAGPLLTAPA
jgi:galactokinase